MTADPGVIADLERRGLAYEVMDCDPALADTAQFCQAYGIPLDRSANTILVASRRPEGRVAACLVLATTRLDVNGAVRRRMGVRKASFANAEQTRETTGMEMGGVTIFGLAEGIQVWVDSRVVEPDWVIVGAGSRTAKIRLDPSQLVAAQGFDIVDDLAVAPAP